MTCPCLEHEVPLHTSSEGCGGSQGEEEALPQTESELSESALSATAKVVNRDMEGLLPHSFLFGRFLLLIRREHSQQARKHQIFRL